MRLSETMCTRLRREQEGNPDKCVALLALWHEEGRRLLRVWIIPLEIIDKMDGMLPSGVGDSNKRNVRIDGQNWLSTSSGINAKIDISNYYQEWDLTDEEMQHIQKMEDEPEKISR